MINPALYPHTSHIVGTLVRLWPEHGRFMEQSFARRDEALMRSTEAHAGIIQRMVGSDARLERYCTDYRFLCDKVLEEEIFFRRHGHYRLSKFEDALAEVYSNREFMDAYMNFLLLSHVLWENHAQAMAHFEAHYLATLPQGARHLEIGPGHGMLLHLAARSANVASLTGWDVSATSIEQTRHCLEAMGETRAVSLVLQDLFDAPNDPKAPLFDSVVMAEVLEHLEDPVAALKAVGQHMVPGGRLWIHVPINSPAPAHLYLLRTPEDARELVKAGAFEPLDTAGYPMSGQTMERARKRELTISAVISARKA